MVRKNIKKYETFNHAKTKLRYHLIFSTKYRKNCLENIREDIFKYMLESEHKYGNYNIEIMEIDNNHIHFLLKIKPCENISNVVKYLKQYSTYNIWKNHHEYMTKFYWKKHYLWTRGYFITSIGECSEDKIRSYINNQG
jgi:putative transposase